MLFLWHYIILLQYKKCIPLMFLNVGDSNNIDDH